MAGVVAVIGVVRPDVLRPELEKNSKASNFKATDILRDGPFLASFSLFPSFLFNSQLVDKTLPMLGLEPRISGDGSDLSTN